MTSTLGNTETRQACSTMHGAALNTLTFFFFFGICMHIYTDRYTYAHTHKRASNNVKNDDRDSVDQGQKQGKVKTGRSLSFFFSKRDLRK